MACRKIQYSALLRLLEGQKPEEGRNCEWLSGAAVISYLAFWFVWSLLLAIIWTKNPELHHGDSYSDANQLLASQNIREHGFLYHYGFPDSYQFSKDPKKPRLYLHYPPGPLWVHELIRLLALRELWQLRLITVVLTSMTGLLALFVFGRLSGSAAIGALSAFFYIWNRPYSEFIDSLYMHSYM